MSKSKFITSSFQVPNILVDEIMFAITPRAFACLIFIIRKTKGWNKEQDKISNSQIGKVLGTKDNRTISKTTKELEDNNLINITRENGQINTYSLSSAFDKPPTKNVGAKNNTTHKKCKPPPTKNVGATTHKKCSTTKETIKTTNTKEKSKQKKELVIPENINIQAWAKWINYRIEIKKKYKTLTSEQAAINQLSKLPFDNQMQCIDSSIQNEYQGFFTDKYTGANNGTYNKNKKESFFESHERNIKELLNAS